MRTVLIAAVLFALCAGACRCAPRAEFLYVTLHDGMVQGYSVGADGQLTLLPFTPTRVAPATLFDSNGRGVSVTADPVQPMLYISTYQITPHLITQAFLNHTPSPTESEMATAMTPTYNSTLRCFSVGADGQLTPLALAPVPPNESIHAVVVDPKGRFLYALAEGGKVFIYNIASNGALTRRGKTQVTGTYSTNFGIDGDLMGGPVDDCILTFDPNGRFATLGYNTGAIIERWFYTRRYQVKADGTLRAVQQPPLTKGSMEGIAANKDAVYLSAYRFTDKPSPPNRGYTDYSGIRQYQVRKNGALVLRHKLREGNDAGEIHLDPQGRFLYAGGKDVDVYRIGTGGSLSFASHAAHGTIMPDPSGRFLYDIQESGNYTNYAYALVGCAVRPDGTLGTPFTLPVQSEPESLVFARR